jgi:hypothetical protein
MEVTPWLFPTPGLGLTAAEGTTGIVPLRTVRCLLP